MRTTLDVADDVLLAAKAIAQRDKRSLGDLFSEWGRQALTRPLPTATNSATAPHPLERFGVRPLPHRGGVVTNELIDGLRDDGPD